MSLTTALPELESEFAARFGAAAGSYVEDYDWSPGDEGRLVVWPEETLSWQEFDAVFSGWVRGSALFRLVPSASGSYGGVEAPYMKWLYDWENLHVGFRGQRLRPCMCNFGDDLPEARGEGMFCIALSRVPSAPESVLDEVLG